MSQNLIKIKEKVALLPDSPGVYQFLGDAGQVIYVGKAKNLKRRVSSYFVSSASHSGKVRVMVSKIVDLQHTVVGSESEALLLENNMIKSIQPRYNILLKDDKTYPWIVVKNEPFPRIVSTRRRDRDGSQYFGPYGSVSIQRAVLEMLRSIYTLRTCSLNLSPAMIARGKYGVCLEYHIGNCKAPCIGAQSVEEYAQSIKLATSLLKGDTRATRGFLQFKMEEAAAAMRFEEAERYRKRIEILTVYHSKSVVVSNVISDIDVVSLLIDQSVGYCNFMKIVDGAVIMSLTVELKLGVEEEPQEVLTYALSKIADRMESGLSREILVPFLPSQELFEGVRFSIPQRGDKVRLMELSERNCRLYRLEKLKQIEIKDPARHTDRILASIQKELHLNELPRHIECFDNSNLQGTHPVAACVVFRDGKPSKREYRHFNIKTVVGANDFASMEEVISRRYSRLKEEGAQMPQLIVVDGGKGQLSFAYETLRRLGLHEKIAIVGLAKRIEEVFFPHDNIPYYLDRNSEALKVLMHIRDESHRFGVTFHRNKRSAAFIKSELEQIPTLGPRSVEALLKRFKTVLKIRKATLEELEEVVGNKRASEVVKYFTAFEIF